MDRTLLMPMRYSAGPMLGNRMFSLYLPFWPEAFGHWGFTNIACWADPSRDIVVSLLNNGKAFLGLYVLVYLRLLSLIAKHCPSVNSARANIAARHSEDIQR
jgi:CubicO group peptidase (beta-lactamase class C family)